jgi:hypothetical protein
MALLESQSNATNSLRASRAIGEGSFNSMKVDYPFFRPILLPVSSSAPHPVFVNSSGVNNSTVVALTYDNLYSGNCLWIFNGESGKL